MTTQNYCIVNETTGICENVCLWDGDSNSWTPPSGYIALIQATTSAKVWGYESGVYCLIAQNGAGQIGFVWDGACLVTSEPMPTELVQPMTTGAQTL